MRAFIGPDPQLEALAGELPGPAIVIDGVIVHPLRLERGNASERGELVDLRWIKTQFEFDLTWLVHILRLHSVVMLQCGAADPAFHRRGVCISCTDTR